MASAEPSNQGPDDDLAAQPSERSFPIVAIGASAGGLEAFTTLLRHLPADTGMAFVFIQHLDPTHESMLAELLARATTMPVNEAEDGMALSPNQVYVIPPNAAMTISGLVLALKPRATAGITIDAFLRSLAGSQKGGAVGVILSGTGSDGALGVQAIAEEGGVVFAQDPQSAKFDGMPRSAIATGCADFVLPPEQIAAELSRIAREPRLVQGGTAEPAAQLSGSEPDFQAVLELLCEGTGIDFNLYRQTTVRRRVLRRLGLLRQGGLDNYLQHLRANPDELHTLAQDILIPVTRFFRDPETFEVLNRRVFAELIRKTPPDRAVRVWVPGCSTGEEAYSLAISFLEVAEKMQSRVPVQVFATDINEAAIEKARRGTYIENIAADVSPERLARFFVRAGSEFQVGRVLRNLCVFSRHDLLNDPAFSRMDLVSCRNVLIYLDSMQSKALSLFHFALNPGGFLLLGRSETALSAPELFTAVDKQARLYVRQECATLPAPQSTHRKRSPALSPREDAASPRPRPLQGIDLRNEADRVIVERYGPPRVIVDDKLAVLTSSDDTAALLEAVPEGLRDELSRAIRTAKANGGPVRVEQVKLGAREASLEVTPLGSDRQHFLIALEEHREPHLSAGEASAEDERKLDRRIHRLRKELAASRAHLESIIVEQEAANEEVVAANEELQSLNEELASSKEELEATNEELTTVNQELQIRNTELESAREFAQATIDTVRGSLVVLGPDLRVLRANKPFYRTFRVSPEKVEHRFIYELGDGHWSVPRLRLLLEEILPKNSTLEDFEMQYEIPPEGRRVLLLNARRFEREDRILLAIEDVTAHRRLEEELRQSQKMEAVGHLAAGVAHDFNNLLTGMMGSASLLLEDLAKKDWRRSRVESVLKGGERAADLVRQLLAYAGKGRFYLERVDISEQVIQTSRLIHTAIPANVQLRLDLDRHLPLFLADPSQVQQVVMNLIINAAEAIGSASGTVLVRTGRQAVGHEPLPDLYLNEKVPLGEYVFLEVQDTGSGMDEETRRRIFDPFFTTKFVGRGLGLAAVLGIARQYKGAVQVHSVPGRGSTFRVLFSSTEPVALDTSENEIPRDLRGAGTVLVVDDEEMIRSFSKSALEPYGYSVLLAQDGQEAMRLFEERASEIALVLLDVAMPGMDGLETLEWIQACRPQVPVVVCSGFGDEDVEKRFEGKDVAGFLQKPYTVKQLARKVKESMRPAAPAD